MLWSAQETHTAAFQGDPRVSLLGNQPFVNLLSVLRLDMCPLPSNLTQAPHSTTVHTDIELTEKITFKQSKQHHLNHHLGPEHFNQLEGSLVIREKVSCYSNFLLEEPTMPSLYFNSKAQVIVIP